MKFAKVLGSVVATQKYRDLEGIKLLVVQPLDEDLEPRGLVQVAADATAQAAPGELVFIVASREASQALPETFVPVDLAIAGIVDEVHVPERGAGAQGTAIWDGPSDAAAQETEQ